MFDKMIYWSLESLEDEPLAPGGWLAPEEQARYAALKIDRRRREWLLGRRAAKRLLQAFWKKEHGELVPPTRFVIGNGTSGAPHALLDGRPVPGVALSLSHSNGRAFVALATDCPVLGADIEKAEPRSETFVGDYLTRTEEEWVHKARGEELALRVTLLWSAKEAALKARGVGLSVDTRAVECLPDMLDSGMNWKRVSICCNMNALQAAPPLSGWWRRYDEFVLALAAQEKPFLPDMEPVHLVC